MSNGDILLSDPIGITGFPLNHVFSCPINGFPCGVMTGFRFGDMFADDNIKAAPSAGVPDMFYSNGEFVWLDGTSGTVNGLYEPADNTGWWQGEAVHKSSNSPFYRKINSVLPLLKYHDRNSSGIYDSNEDIINDRDSSGYYNADKLLSIRVVNNGTCTDSSITAIRIYQDGPVVGWNGDETQIGLDNSGAMFDQIITTSGSQPYSSSSGRRIFAAVDISPSAAAGCTFNLAVVQNGLVLASTNDGPTDAKLNSLDTVTVSGGGGTAPTNTSVLINNNASTTNSVNVTLNLSATNASQMSISNSSSFSGAVWETYSTSRAWTLTSGDGTKTVYVKFKSSTGAESAVVSDSIVLSASSASYSVLINNNASTTNSVNVTLNLSATNASQMSISNSSSFSGAVWETYSTSRAWTLTSGDGTKTVYVKFKSSTGAESAVVSDSIVLSTSSAYGHQVVDGVDYNAGNRWVKTADRSTVYLLDQFGWRHAYPHEKIWASYFGSDFSFVRTISTDEMASYPLGRNVPFNVGTLMKIQSVNKVYKIETGAMRRWVVDEPTARYYWGPDWSKLVKDLSVAFWQDYVDGPNLTLP